MLDPTYICDAGRRRRFRPDLVHALQLINLEGYDPREAAKAAGLTYHAVYSARRKPHVKTFETALIQARASGLGERAVKTLEALLDDKSASVRLRAVEIILRETGHLARLAERANPSDATGPGRGGNAVNFQVVINGDRAAPRPDDRGIIDITPARADDMQSEAQSRKTKAIASG
jgi:hypothetical protein